MTADRWRVVALAGSMAAAVAGHIGNLAGVVAGAAAALAALGCAWWLERRGRLR